MLPSGRERLDGRALLERQAGLGPVLLALLVAAHEAAGLPDLSWYDLLWALYRRPERRRRVNELAREVVLSPTAMSRFVDRVEAAGHLRREPDPADRRALQIGITDSGVELLRRMWPVYAAVIEAHFAPFLGRAPERTAAMLEQMAASAAATGA